MILKKVKPLRQKRRMCGPASLEIVLKYYGGMQKQDELKKLLGSSYFHGTSNDSMVEVSRKLGFKVRHRSNSSIEEIRKLISRKVPPIVGWFTPEGSSHYSVVSGIDERHIFIVDPELNKIRKFNIKNFEERWHDVNWDKMSYFRKLILGLWIVIYNKIIKKGVLPLLKKDIVRGEIIIIEKK
jgi:ABC-type bacteriocin/lantibiotic exporter with double-glycine peptidase domain